VGLRYESREVDIAVKRGEADGRTEVLYDLVHTTQLASEVSLTGSAQEH